MKKNTYYCLKLYQIPPHLEDIITHFCFEFGASGVSEPLAFSQPDLNFEPSVSEHRLHNLEVYFLEKPPEACFLKLKELHPSVQWSLLEEEEKDWLEEWKKGFIPFKLVGPFWIIPSWCEIPSACTEPLFIDPGMAFGTGTHATTQMMAHFIYKLSKAHSLKISSWNLLDVGTGTGILAMLAEKAGFSKVQGIEIDPEARRVARENISRNHLNKIFISEKLIEETHGSYNVIAANIIDGVLLKIQKDLLRLLAPEGHLLLTGILLERDNSFFEAFIEKKGLRVVQRLEKDEWVGYWVQKIGDTP